MVSSYGESKASCSYPPPLLTRTYIELSAKKLLLTRELRGLSNFITDVCYGKETEESSSSSKLLYDGFIHHYPDIMAIKLLKIYIFRPLSAKIRSFCLELLDSLLLDLVESRVGLKRQFLGKLKTYLNDCLNLEETSDHDFKLLSSIISCVSVHVFTNNLPWEGLCSYISCISDDEYKKPLLMFIDLPMLLDENFLIILLENDFLVKIFEGLLDQDYYEEEGDWCLYLEAGFNMALQLSNLQRKPLVCDLVYAIVKSVWEMVKVKRREIDVRKGLIKLADKVRKEALRFREGEFEVVIRLVSMIKSIDELSEETNIAANLILEGLEKYYKGGKGIDWGFVKRQLLIG